MKPSSHWRGCQCPLSMLPYQTPRATTAARLAMPQNHRLARLRYSEAALQADMGAEYEPANRSRAVSGAGSAWPPMVASSGVASISSTEA